MEKFHTHIFYVYTAIERRQILSNFITRSRFEVDKDLIWMMYPCQNGEAYGFIIEICAWIRVRGILGWEKKLKWLTLDYLFH